VAYEVVNEVLTNKACTTHWPQIGAKNKDHEALETSKF